MTVSGEFTFTPEPTPTSVDVAVAGIDAPLNPAATAPEGPTVDVVVPEGATTVTFSQPTQGDASIRLWCGGSIITSGDEVSGTLRIEATGSGQAAITIHREDQDSLPLPAEIINVTIHQADIQIDGDNDQETGTPADDSNDVKYEYQMSGKYIQANDGDLDHDGIPDFADGFDFDGENANDDDGPTDRFVPVVLKLSSTLDLAKAGVKVLYQVSDPSDVAADDADHWSAQDGLRLWTSTTNRTGDPLDDQSIAGKGYYLDPCRIYMGSELQALFGEAPHSASALKSADPRPPPHRPRPSRGL